jgi:methyl-accepting chemotaxis protein
MYRTGKGRLDEIITKAHRFHQQVVEKMTGLQESGIHLFDRRYQEIPNTAPKKYMTQYTKAFDQHMQPLFDSFLQEEKDAVYALATDVNGYLPTHHSKCSKPLTGKYDIDLLNSRDKRIYDSLPMEKKRSKNTGPMLLQTNMRDTGEIVSEISMPIFINNQHWGGFIFAFAPAALEKGKTAPPAAARTSAKASSSAGSAIS